MSDEGKEGSISLACLRPVYSDNVAQFCLLLSLVVAFTVLLLTLHPLPLAWQEEKEVSSPDHRNL